MDKVSIRDKLPKSACILSRKGCVVNEYRGSTLMVLFSMELPPLRIAYLLTVLIIHVIVNGEFR